MCTHLDNVTRPRLRTDWGVGMEVFAGKAAVSASARTPAVAVGAGGGRGRNGKGEGEERQGVACRGVRGEGRDRCVAKDSRRLLPTLVVYTHFHLRGSVLST